MLQVRARLVDRIVSGVGQELRFDGPDLANQLRPGQPILVRMGWGLDPYLRRTFYPIELSSAGWTLRLPASGDRGHAWLRLAPLGTEVDCLGPVGQGFRLPAGARHVLCLGEGELCWTLLPVVFQADAAQLAVTLAAGAGYTVGTPSDATVTIADNDLPAVTVAASDGSPPKAGQVVWGASKLTARRKVPSGA